MSFIKGTFKNLNQQQNKLTVIKNISLNGLMKLLDENKKILIVSPNLNYLSSISKLYYILKNSNYNNRIYPSNTITFDKRTMTRIHSNIKVKGLHEVKEDCVFVYYKNITNAMLNNRTLILIDWIINKHNKKLEEEINYLINRYNFDYKFDERLFISKELSIESYDENYYRRLYQTDSIPKIPIINQKYLIFDTETNGIPIMDNYRCVRYDHETGWDNCRMLSIAWLVVDDKFNIINQEYHLIKDESIFNTVHAQKINKITDQERNKIGIVFNDMIDKLFRDVDECTHIVSHGSDFDFNLLIKECQLHDINYSILNDKTVLNTKQNLWKPNHKMGLSDIIKIESDLEPHNPLYDCLLCLELLKIRLNVNNK